MGELADRGIVTPGNKAESLAPKTQTILERQAAAADRPILETKIQVAETPEGLRGTQVPIYGEAKPVDVREIMRDQSRLGKIARDAKDPVTGRPTAEAEAAVTARHNLADLTDQLIPGLAEANKDYSALSKARLLDRQRETAILRAQQYNPADIASRQRARVTDILVNPRMHLGWTPEQLAQAGVVNKGTIPGRAAEALSRTLQATGVARNPLAAAAVGSGIGAGMASYYGSNPVAAGGIGSVVPALIGAGARRIGKISTNRQIDKLDRMLRGDSPLGRKMAEQSAVTRRNERVINALRGGFLQGQ